MYSWWQCKHINYSVAEFSAFKQWLAAPELIAECLLVRTKCRRSIRIAFFSSYSHQSPATNSTKTRFSIIGLPYLCTKMLRNCRRPMIGSRTSSRGELRCAIPRTNCHSAVIPIMSRYFNSCENSVYAQCLRLILLLCPASS